MRACRLKPLHTDDAALAKVFTRLATHGRVLVVVNQPASIGVLAVAVAHSLEITVAYLPGLAIGLGVLLWQAKTRAPPEPAITS